MKVIINLLLLILVSNTTVLGQNDTNITYGIKLGALYSQISNLPECIKGKDNTYDTSILKSNGVFGFEGGFFLNLKLHDTRVAIQPEILFQQSGEQISYTDNLGKEFQVELNYSYLKFGAMYKIYPYEGLNLGFGVFYGINLSPNSVSYTSNQANGQYDVATRQFYIDGLEGTGDFSLSFGLGYELRQSIHFDFRYYLGVNDVVNSNASSFQFIENQNKSSVFSFSIGYSFHKW